MTSPTQDRLAQQIRNILDAEEAYEARDQEFVAKLEARGWRIVSGGQRGACDADGNSDFACTDWRTGQTLVQGRGTVEDFAAAVEAAEAKDGRTWCDREQVTINATDGAHDDLDLLLDPERVPGLPESLMSPLIDWVETAPAEEIAEVAGLPVDRVRGQLRHLPGHE